MSLRICVVEDEEIVARRLVRLLRELLGDRLGSLETLRSLESALDHIRTQPVDVLFLDLDLGGQDGFTLLHEAVAGSFQTIVVSARHDQAVRAFEYGVADFVAKPYDKERLATAVRRVTDREDALRRRLKVLAVRGVGEIIPIPIETVVHVKGAGDYSEIHTQDGSRHLHAKTLSRLEQILPPGFERVHRSHLVDLSRVTKLVTLEGGRHVLRLQDGQEIPVGRSRLKALLARFR